MRTLLLASAAVLALGGSAFAQNATGNPHSATASNITASDTHSNLAPALPSPGMDLDAEQLLHRAAQAVRSGQSGLAQSALEQAETRLLTRATAPSQANMRDNGPRIDAITKALHALANRDRPATMRAIQMAMNGGGQMGGMSNGTMGNGMMNNGGMSPSMSPGAASSMQTPIPANGIAQGKTAMPTATGNNPAGEQGGGGNEAAGPAQ